MNGTSFFFLRKHTHNSDKLRAALEVALAELLLDGGMIHSADILVITYKTTWAAAADWR